LVVGLAIPVFSGGRIVMAVLLQPILELWKFRAPAAHRSIRKDLAARPAEIVPGHECDDRAGAAG
jgi:hypothetical protein